MWAGKTGQGLLGPSPSSLRLLDKVTVQDQRTEDTDVVQSEGLFLPRCQELPLNRSYQREKMRMTNHPGLPRVEGPPWTQEFQF